MVGNKKVLFLLSGNISTTPRAKKVLETLETLGYTVDLIMFNRGGKWANLDKEYLANHNLSYQYLPFTRRDNFIVWAFSSMMNRWLENKKCKNVDCMAMASSKINAIFRMSINRIPKEHYHFIYGFSSMLWPAYYLAKKTRLPFAFDMEDYHPLENIYHKNKELEISRRERLFSELLPQAEFVTYAAPLIMAKSKELLGKYNVRTKKDCLINNTFQASDFLHTECSDSKIQFVWFSQTVSYGRGLEQILPALAKYKDHVRLTVIGNLDESFYEKELSSFRDLLIVKPAMAQSDLHQELCKYDVGLAIEQTNKYIDNGNKELCLSNKIFSYLLAGLYIMATDTKAQSDFIHTHKSHGVVSGQTTETMSDVIEMIIKNIAVIRAEKSDRYLKAKEFGWESEQKKIIELFKSI